MTTSGKPLHRAMRKALIAAGLSGILLLSACDTSNNNQNQPSLELNAQVLTQDSDTTLVVEGDTVAFTRYDLMKNPDSLKMEVETRNRRIKVYNGFYMLDSPYTSNVMGEVDRNKNVIRISIGLEREEHSGDVIPTIAHPLLYNAQVTGLDAGTYHLVVRHKEHLGAEGWKTVLERQVDVD